VWLVRYAPRLASGARGPSNEGMLITPAGSDRAFLHTHPGGTLLASSPKTDGVHIAMRFVVGQYHCEALVVPPSGEGNPAYAALVKDAPEPEPPKPEPTWDEALENFEETVTSWLGLSEEDPKKPRTAEERYLEPEFVPNRYSERLHGTRAHSDDDDTSSRTSSSSTVSDAPYSNESERTRSGSGRFRAAQPNAERSALEELERLRERLAFLEAKAAGDDALATHRRAKLEAVAASKATTVSKLGASARGGGAFPPARRPRPRLLLPPPVCAAAENGCSVAAPSAGTEAHRRDRGVS